MAPALGALIAVACLAACGTSSGSTSSNGTVKTCLYSFSAPKPFNKISNVCMNHCTTSTSQCTSYGRLPVPVTVIDPLAPPGSPKTDSGLMDPRPQRCGCKGGGYGSSTRDVSSAVRGKVGPVQGIIITL